MQTSFNTLPCITLNTLLLPFCIVPSCLHFKMVVFVHLSPYQLSAGGTARHSFKLLTAGCAACAQSSVPTAVLPSPPASRTRQTSYQRGLWMDVRAGLDAYLPVFTGVDAAAWRSRPRTCITHARLRYARHQDGTGVDVAFYAHTPRQTAAPQRPLYRFWGVTFPAPPFVYLYSGLPRPSLPPPHLPLPL